MDIIEKSAPCDIYVSGEAVQEDDGTSCIYKGPDEKLYRVFGALPTLETDRVATAIGYRRLRAIRIRTRERACSFFIDAE